MTIADGSLSQFLSAVASSAVIPSAGAVTAVGGAAGAALCEMVCLHTVEKDGYDEVTDELAEVGEELRDVRHRLLALADEDVAAVEAVQAAPDDRKRQKRATEVPLEVAELSLVVLESAAVVAVDGTETARADAVAGGRLACAAICASLVIVRTNRKRVDDEPFLTVCDRRIDEVEHSVQTVPWSPGRDRCL